MEAKLSLSEFLSDKLFSFISEDTSPINSHAACGSDNVADELDLLLLRAIENFEDSNDQETSTASKSRPFGIALSVENIEQVIQSTVPESTKKDTKYYVSIWDEWVVARGKSTGTIIPYLKDMS